jgi:exoribonuclease R
VPRRSIRLVAPAEDLHETFEAIRAEIGIPDAFPADVLDEAERAAREPRLPRSDLTDVPFVTLDPPASMDLDQAFHLERLPRGGIRLRYAIADVAAFVTPGGAVDREAHARVETMYSPDERAPLYPPVLSEAATSLLPDGPRPAVVWSIDVDDAGSAAEAHVERAMVASRAKLAYPDVQAALDDGSADEMLRLLPEIGSVLQRAERARGGSNLGIPRQEVVQAGDGYSLTFEAPLAVEGWNAQLSLLTGRAAADIMLRDGVGVIRTMPPPDPHDVARLRRVADGLRIEWPAHASYSELLHTIDASRSDAESVFLQEAAVLFRGASYSAFDGRVPPGIEHAAIAAHYAHCTAPLRRLVDRYANEVCLALCSGSEVPTWAREALPALPIEMALGAERGHRLERTIVDAVEAAVLSPLVGTEADALVVDLWKRGRGEVALRAPAVIGPCDDVHELGAEVRVRLEEADVQRHTIRFARVRAGVATEPARPAPPPSRGG